MTSDINFLDADSAAVRLPNTQQHLHNSTMSGAAPPSPTITSGDSANPLDPVTEALHGRNLGASVSSPSGSIAEVQTLTVGRRCASESSSSPSQSLKRGVEIRNSVPVPSLENSEPCDLVSFSTDPVEIAPQTTKLRPFNLADPIVQVSSTEYTSPPLPINDSVTPCNSQDLEEGPAEKTNGSRSTFKLLRSYTDVFSLGSSTSPTGELPKVAIKQGIRENWLKIAPHVVAVSVTLAVCQLSFRNVYWMDLLSPEQKISPGLTQSGALSFLQLAAKLHELLILTSISSIVLHIVQVSLTGSKGLPLGMVANAFELGSAQFLRRKSFWSSIWTVDPVTGKRFPFKPFWLLSICSTLLVLLSGPSSAIAVIPTLRYFEVPRPQPLEAAQMPYYLWNYSMELWPQVLSAASIPINETLTLMGDGSDEPFTCTDIGTSQDAAVCPGGGFSETYDWAHSILLQSMDLVSNLTIRDTLGDTERVLTTQSCNSTFHGHASGMSIVSFIGKSVGAYWKYARTHFQGHVLTSSRPRVTLQAESNVFAPHVETICQNWAPNGDLGPYFDGQNPEVLLDMNFPTFDNSVNISVPYWTYKFSRQLNTTNFTFVEILPSGPSTPSLGAVITIPDVWDSDDGTTTRQTSMLIVCSIYSQWVPVDISYEPTLSPQVSYTVKDDLSNTCLTLDTNRDATRKSINTTIGIDYATSLNQPAIMFTDTGPRLNMLFESFVSYEDFSDDDIEGNEVPGGAFFNTPAIELDPDYTDTSGTFLLADDESLRIPARFIATILTGVVTNGLAQIAGNGKLWSEPMFISPNRTESGTLIGILVSSENTDGTRMDLETTEVGDWKELKPRFDRYGYGYSWSRSPTTQFGITVLLIHTTVAIIHTIYLLSFLARSKWKGGFPSSWESIPEIFALAINSRPSDKLKNTSAGIKESSTWGQVVAVRENSGGQHLEVVVGKNEMEGLPRARVGYAYG